MQYEILQQLLQVANDGSLTMSRVASDDFNRMADAIPRPIEWMSPNDATNVLRGQAKSEVQRIKSLIPSLIKEEQAFRTLSQSDPIRDYQVVGVLGKGKQGNWILQTRGSEIVRGELFIAGPRSGSGQMQSIGEVDGDNLSLIHI